jgi:hypothetical protein
LFFFNVVGFYYLSLHEGSKGSSILHVHVMGVGAGLKVLYHIRHYIPGNDRHNYHNIPKEYSCSVDIAYYDEGVNFYIGDRLKELI